MERGIRTSEKPVKQPTTEELLHEVNNYLISGLRNPETLHTKAQVANAIVMRVLARVGRVEGIVGLHFAVFLVRRGCGIQEEEKRIEALFRSEGHAEHFKNILEESSMLSDTYGYSVQIVTPNAVLSRVDKET